MPQSKEKHRERMREVMRKKRLQPKPSAGVVELGSNIKKLQPKLNIPGLKIEGNKIIGVELQPKVEVLQPIPRYNPKVHKEGDRVLRFFNNKWVEVTVPEIDLDR